MGTEREKKTLFVQTPDWGISLSANFFQNDLFQKILLRILSVSNNLDPDQDWHSVSPDLGPNYLQR